MGDDIHGSDKRRKENKAINRYSGCAEMFSRLAVSRAWALGRRSLHSQRVVLSGIQPTGVLHVSTTTPANQHL
jgi:hypothetical protein